MPQNQNPTSSDEFDNLFDDQPILNGVGSDQAKSQSVDPSQKMNLQTSNYPLPIIWFKGSQNRCEISLSKVRITRSRRMGRYE